MGSTDFRNKVSGLQELLEARTRDLEETKMMLQDAHAQNDTHAGQVVTLEADRTDLQEELRHRDETGKLNHKLWSKTKISLDEQLHSNVLARQKILAQGDELKNLRTTVQNMEIEREHMTEDIVGLQQARDSTLEGVAEFKHQCYQICSDALKKPSDSLPSTVEHTAPIDSNKALYKSITEQEADQPTKLEATHEMIIANLKAAHESHITRIHHESGRALDSPKAEHPASIDHMQQEHAAETKQIHTYHNEMHEHHDNLVDCLNEGHLQELDKLKAGSKARATDAFEHTRHDREYIAQIDVLNEKIIKQQDAILTDARGIRADSKLISDLRSQLAELEVKMTQKEAELKEANCKAQQCISNLATFESHVEELETDYEVEIAVLRKATDKMERLRVEMRDVEGELAGARDEVRFWKGLFEDQEGVVEGLKKEKEKEEEEGDWGVKALD